MALGALSVCLTVLVLNLHHRDDERPVPAWAQTLVLDYLATALCVAGNQLHRHWTADDTEQDNPPAQVIRQLAVVDTADFGTQFYSRCSLSLTNDWVKKCMEYEVDGRPRGRPKKTWREIVEKDCRARGLNMEDAMDRSRWRKQIGMIDNHDECEWINVSSGTGSPGLFQTNSTEP